MYKKFGVLDRFEKLTSTSKDQPNVADSAVGAWQVGMETMVNKYSQT